MKGTIKLSAVMIVFLLIGCIVYPSINPSIILAPLNTFLLLILTVKDLHKVFENDD